MSEKIYNECNDRMEKTISHYQSEISTIRAGRASTTLLDSVKVDFYGTQSPINNIALISAPDPHLITVQPYDPNALEAIEKAITSSDVNLTPNNDGAIIRLSIPPLTEERRKDLVKFVHHAAIAIRASSIICSPDLSFQTPLSSFSQKIFRIKVKASLRALPNDTNIPGIFAIVF